jgi:hypothetical protein
VFMLIGLGRFVVYYLVVRLVEQDVE